MCLLIERRIRASCGSRGAPVAPDPNSRVWGASVGKVPADSPGDPASAATGGSCASDKFKDYNPGFRPRHAKQDTLARKIRDSALM